MSFIGGSIYLIGEPRTESSNSPYGRGGSVLCDYRDKRDWFPERFVRKTIPRLANIGRFANIFKHKCFTT